MNCAICRLMGIVMVPRELKHLERGAPWFGGLRIVPNPRLRLVVFPFAGGSSGSYRGWARGLPEDVEIQAAQLPGRVPRMLEPPLRQMAPMLDALALAIVPLLDRPLVFFGHSMGANLAFELARRLRRAGHPLPALLMLSGRPAPRWPRDPTFAADPVHRMPSERFWETILSLNGTPAAVRNEPELRALMEPTLRADFEVSETWVSPEEPPLPAPMLLLGGREDAGVPHAALQAWASETTRGADVEMFDGDHFYLQQSEAALWASLSARLRAVGR